MTIIPAVIFPSPKKIAFGISLQLKKEYITPSVYLRRRSSPPQRDLPTSQRLARIRFERGISLMVKHQFSKLRSGVRFSHPAQKQLSRKPVFRRLLFSAGGRIEGEHGHPASRPGRASVVRRRYSATAEYRALGRFSHPAHVDSQMCSV